MNISETNEKRIEDQKERHDNLRNRVEQHKDDRVGEIADIYRHVNHVHTDIIKCMREDKQDVLKEFRCLEGTIIEKLEASEDRLSFLEGWRWKIVGGMTAIGVIVSAIAGILSFNIVF